VAGTLFLSLALILATRLALDEVLHLGWFSWAAAGGVALLIGATWWLIPLRARGS
jgi:hypothetical protein